MEAAFVLLLIFYATPSAAAQNKNSTIPVLSELKPGTNSSVWISESGIFAFGFRKIADGYAVCIYMIGDYYEPTVVWMPNNLYPVLPLDIFSLVINQDRIQLFQKRQGIKAVYYNIATTEEAIAGASMLDNGNFVVYNSNGGVIWQSFDSPSDTLLPGQRLQAGQELVSREDGLGRERFRLKMQTDGNLVQYPVSSSDTAENAYYDSGTYGKGDNLSLNLGNDGRLYLYNGHVSYDIASGGRPKGGSIYMVRVDIDGIFRLYNGWLGVHFNWTVIWSSTEDKCVPKGICEANTICTHKGETVTCTCLPGFNNDCRNEFDYQECREKNPSVRYEMRRMANMTWEEDYYAVNDTVTEQDCVNVCVSDCGCVVASYRDGKCRKQRLPIRYGMRPTADSNVALLKVTLPASTPPVEPPNASSGN